MIACGPLNRWTTLSILAAVLVIEAVGIAVVIASEHQAQHADEAKISVFQRAGPGWTRVSVNVFTGSEKPRSGEKAGLLWRKRPPEPILCPTSLTADEAKLPPDEMVIGVEADGKFQAYQLSAFESKSGHLVNDLVGGVPVSVAYCNLSQCLRIYSDPQSRQPLDLTVAGVLNDDMVIKHAGKMYSHESGQAIEPDNGPAKLPYGLIPPTLITWKEWAERHPDTRVYVGPQEGGTKGAGRPMARPGQ